MAYNIAKQLKLLSLWGSIQDVYVKYGNIDLIQINYLSGSYHEGIFFFFSHFIVKGACIYSTTISLSLLYISYFL